MPELPNGLNWNRLAEEMTGNIRVGLAAGEAIALFDKPLRTQAPARLAVADSPGMPRCVVLGATVIFAIAFWTSLPPAAGRAFAGLLGAHPHRTYRHSGAFGCRRSAVPGAAPEDVVLEASSSSIQVRENGRAMSLIPHSDGATVSVSMHGSAGVRFVDADTGQVTTNKVYYAEQ